MPTTKELAESIFKKIFIFEVDEQKFYSRFFGEMEGNTITLDLIVQVVDRCELHKEQIIADLKD